MNAPLPSGAIAVAPLEISLLGPLVVNVGGEATPITAGKRRAFLAALALEPDCAVPTATLSETIWGERPPASAEHALAVYASELRHLLGGERIVRTSAGYRLAAAREDVDLCRVEELARTGRSALEAGNAERAAAVLAETLALFRGDPLSDVPSEALEPERERIRALRLSVLEDRLEADLAVGRHLAVVAELEALVEAEPLRERPLRLLMLALYRCGRQADALARYRAARRFYCDELGLEPGPELLALERSILSQDPRLELPRSSVVQLPRPPSRFVGRAEEIDELRDLLVAPDVRLVTVTGTGGVGKTRLAIEAAAAAAPVFAGTHFVELAPVAEPRLIEPTIARVLEAESVAVGIGDRRVLLVLDNLEHLLAGVRDVAGFLRACPNLTVLATSRERLRVTGEHVFALDSLAPLDAVELFVDRARASDRRFEPTPAVQLLCARLEQLPQAIELAAARVDELPVDQLLAAWSERVDLAAEGPCDVHDRQRTLEATIGWSYDLLSEPVQAAFRRLGVLRSGFTEEAATEVAGAERDIVAALVRKSLVVDLAGRCRLLEPIREFAVARLESAGEIADVRRAHAGYYAALVERHGPPVTFLEPDGGVSMQVIEDDFDNVRTALRWARTNDVVLHARMAAALNGFWYHTGRVVEGQDELGFALAAEDEIDAATRAATHLGASSLMLLAGDSAAGLLHSERAYELFRTVGDNRGIAMALLGAGFGCAVTDPARAQRACHEAAEASSRAGCAEIERVAWGNASFIALDREDSAAARAYLEAAAAVPGDPGPFNDANIELGLVAVEIADGDWAAAAARLDRGFELLSAHSWTHLGVCYLLEEGELALADGEAELAAQLLGAAEACLEDAGIGVETDPIQMRMLDRLASGAPARIGNAAFERARVAGAALSAGEAMELAHARRHGRERQGARDLSAA